MNEEHKDFLPVVANSKLAPITDEIPGSNRRMDLFEDSRGYRNGFLEYFLQKTEPGIITTAEQINTFLRHPLVQQSLGDARIHRIRQLEANPAEAIEDDTLLLAIAAAKYALFEKATQQQSVDNAGESRSTGLERPYEQSLRSETTVNGIKISVGFEPDRNCYTILFPQLIDMNRSQRSRAINTDPISLSTDNPNIAFEAYQSIQRSAENSTDVIELRNQTMQHFDPDGWDFEQRMIEDERAYNERKAAAKTSNVSTDSAAPRPPAIEAIQKPESTVSPEEFQRYLDWYLDAYANNATDEHFQELIKPLDEINHNQVYPDSTLSHEVSLIRQREFKNWSDSDIGDLIVRLRKEYYRQKDAQNPPRTFPADL